MVLPKNAADKLKVGGKDKRILDELQTRREFLAQIIKRKMAFILDIHAETIGVIWLRHALLE